MYGLEKKTVKFYVLQKCDSHVLSLASWVTVNSPNSSHSWSKREHFYLLMTAVS